MNSSLKKEIVAFFKDEFADVILKKLQDGHKLSKFKVNPFVLVALSSGVHGNPTSANMAKALLYPRVFGTSISTTFGEKMQRLAVRYLGARASGAPGMDIEFEDKVDSTQVIMQLKAGPNTINSDNVKPIVDKMNSAYRLLQRNGVKKMPTFALGVAYGTIDDVSGHYRRIAASTVGAQSNIPIYIGSDFWHRLTGNPNFYLEMIEIFVDLFEHEDYSGLLEADLAKLTTEIQGKYFTKDKLDIKKF